MLLTHPLHRQPLPRPDPTPEPPQRPGYAHSRIPHDPHRHRRERTELVHIGERGPPPGLPPGGAPAEGSTVRVRLASADPVTRKVLFTHLQ
ncbi:hypothetical protein [Nocardia cyriacigeorgica]|uniref:hypothetical protein n=1 Tax=Nocardia cyriacigeorgica TaxID=135487 RepID=UPI0024568A75|nr:hypothetical protein [Nocardia cyriacigeorgica]